MNKIFYLLSWVGIISAIILLLTSGFWLLYPYKIVTFKTPTYPIVNKIVKQGDFIKYVSDYCKLLDVKPTISRSFVNGIIFTTPMTVTNRDMGCNKLIVAVEVPKELPIGIYHLETNYKYKINPLREIVIKHSSDTFEVKESTQSAELRLKDY
jgi:uncharacterized membrane protein